MKSELYVFEGPNGVGKTTLSTRLSNILNERNHPTDLVALPGKRPRSLGEHVYRFYHQPTDFGVDNISITAEQLLFTAAHADVIENEILPSLNQGRTVVLDRYWWSTWVYATAGGLDLQIRDQLLAIENSVWKGALPNCIFLIRRNRPADFEHDTAKWNQLASLYNVISRQEASACPVFEIDNNGSLDASIIHILRIIQEL